ncbi:serine/threonine-protein kinase [Kangiella shandongensis]|uniref:serine/threonine-protein kinase n=1 Tax=Kangiella shandongensis TaxID=2763258 RepID=UPI001CBBAB73|nr:serine/threonine-protein kinase [Kangiella shandongensis]
MTDQDNNEKENLTSEKAQEGEIQHDQPVAAEPSASEASPQSSNDSALSHPPSPIDEDEDDDKTVVQNISNRSQTHASQQVNLNIGDTLSERYKLVESLGAGGMSEVYKAKDLFAEDAGDKSPYVAVKVLSNEFADHPDAVTIMQREAKKTRELSHPNIVQVFDFIFEKDLCYIVMELLEGESLDKLIKRSRPNGLPKAGVLKVVQQMTSALSFAHKKGVLHSDLKPSNIFITNNQDVKIFDFGVARALKQQIDEYAVQTHSDEPEFDVGGFTPAYASPNMLSNQPIDVRDDVYGLACITYEMLTSKHPYDRKPADKALAKNLQPKKCKKLSVFAWNGLKKGLALKHNERASTVDNFYLGLTKKHSKPILIAASILALSFVGYKVWSTDQTQIKALKSELAALQNEQSKLDAVLATDTKQMDTALNNLSNLTEDHKASALNQLRQPIYEYFSNKAASALKTKNGKYPNYPAALAVFTDAEEYLTDSEQLASYKSQVLSNRNQLLNSLELKYNSLLELQDYAEKENGSDIYSLQADMKQIAPQYQPNISQQAQNLFLTSLTEAMNSNNFAQLQMYQKVGDQIFSHNQQFQKLKSESMQYLSAADKLGTYQKEVADNQEVAFPYDAAKIFYNKTFEDFNNQIETAETVKALDSIAEEMQPLADSLPSDFELLRDTKTNLGNAYIKQADSLNSRRRYRQGARTLKKGREILDQVAKEQS